MNNNSNNNKYEYYKIHNRRLIWYNENYESTNS